MTSPGGSLAGLFSLSIFNDPVKTFLLLHVGHQIFIKGHSQGSPRGQRQGSPRGQGQRSPRGQGQWSPLQLSLPSLDLFGYLFNSPFGILGSVEGLQTLGPDPTSPCL